MMDGFSKQIAWKRKHLNMRRSWRRPVKIVIYRSSYDYGEPPNGRGNNRYKTCYDDGDGRSHNNSISWLERTIFNSFLSTMMLIPTVYFCVNYHCNDVFQRKTNVSVWHLITLACCWDKCHSDHACAY